MSTIRLKTIAAAVMLVIASGCEVTNNEKPILGTMGMSTATEQDTTLVDQAVALPQPVQTERKELRGQAQANDALIRQHHNTAKISSAYSTPGSAPMLSSIRPPSAPVDRENYAEINDNPVVATAEDPVSTFSIDVDTGAYALVRRHLNGGNLPPKDAVRVEEMINYFDYAYAAPNSRATPFSVQTELAPAPWNEDAVLMRVGLKGFEREQAQRPPANLVFLLDVSGSMNQQNKLPLLKNALGLAIKNLNEHDTVSMVVYAGASGVVLEPTPGNEKVKILQALNKLSAGGSTHGSAGIKLAYQMAEQAKVDGSINRVILATDGDFNVGTVNHEQLIDLIERKRDSGIALTTLGFGNGNYNDHLMEQIANHGNGNYAYIDTLNEAQKVLVDEFSANLETIASDVKVQIEWNPASVAEYRLIGYENRVLAREDFNNDKVDAGEIGAGHRVTALYELVLTDSGKRRLPELRYGQQIAEGPDHSNELGWLKLRYKKPGENTSTLVEQAITQGDIRANLSQSSDDFRFAAAVAGFGQVLRGGKYTGKFDYDAISELATKSRGEDPFGYRGEFQRLVRLAESLDQQS